MAQSRGRWRKPPPPALCGSASYAARSAGAAPTHPSHPHLAPQSPQGDFVAAPFSRDDGRARRGLSPPASPRRKLSRAPLTPLRRIAAPHPNRLPTPAAQDLEQHPSHRPFLSLRYGGGVLASSHRSGILSVQAEDTPRRPAEDLRQLGLVQPDRTQLRQLRGDVARVVGAEHHPHRADRAHHRRHLIARAP